MEMDKTVYPPIPLFWEEVVRKERLIRFPNNQRILSAPITMDDFVLFESKGWRYLHCKSNAIDALNYWEIIRTQPSFQGIPTGEQKAYEEEFWERKKQNIIETEDYILSQMGKIEGNPIVYVDLALKGWSEREGTPNSFQGKCFRSPRTIIQFWTYFCCLESNKSWRLPVPPIDSVQSTNSWYMDRVGAPSDHVSINTLRYIKIREQKADYAAFIDHLKKMAWIDFAYFFSLEQKKLEIFYKNWKTNYPQKRPSYRLIDQYANYLNHPYFSTKLTFYQAFPTSKQRRIAEKTPQWIYGNFIQVQHNDFPLQLGKVFEREGKISKEHLKAVVNEFSALRNRKAPLQEPDAVLRTQQRVKLLRLHNDDIEDLGNEQRLQQIRIIRRWKNNFDSSTNLELLVENMRKDRGIPIEVPNSCGLGVFRWKAVANRAYFACPLCSEWQLPSKKHHCMSAWKSCFNVAPHDAVGPFTIELYRASNKHRLSRCLFCFQVSSPRPGRYHQCEKLKAKYINNEVVNEPSWSLKASKVQLLHRQTTQQVCPVFIVHEQPLMTHMRFTPTIISSPNVQATIPTVDFVETGNVIPLVQRQSGIYSLSAIPQFTCFGFVGGNILPEEALDFFPHSTRYSLTCQKQEFSPFVLANAQNFTGLSQCNRHPYEFNCTLMFGRVGTELRCTVVAQKRIHVGDELVLQQVIERQEFASDCTFIASNAQGVFPQVERMRPRIVEVELGGDSDSESDHQVNYGSRACDIDYKRQL